MANFAKPVIQLLSLKVLNANLVRLVNFPPEVSARVVTVASMPGKRDVSSAQWVALEPTNIAKTVYPVYTKTKQAKPPVGAVYKANTKTEVHKQTVRTVRIDTRPRVEPVEH